ncbi:hypothetical protein HPP92_013176 [Vanilla planifolia]|uniref:Cystatin domain-containing protein n=1 Tax=Vanilla planifolia TaxID=51239 RepID=A0A835R1G1_VANPL|nr:hypothetical protein HPP92_013176 [Vanilla planifolia]
MRGREKKMSYYGVKGKLNDTKFKWKSKKIDNDNSLDLKEGWGWAEIPNAGSNAEVRELARYSVEVYNREIRATGESSIDFVRVVSARRQVVSGIKYQIGVAASEVDTGKIRFFDAVIVVRPGSASSNANSSPLRLQPSGVHNNGCKLGP